jgi:hypothetical protein
MMKNKKLLIILAIILAIVLLASGLILILNKKNRATIGNPAVNTSVSNLSVPEFLSVEEKINKGIAPEQKIQVLEKGKNEVYKVIKNESDIVLDPAAVSPISPRQQSVAK